MIGVAVVTGAVVWRQAPACFRPVLPEQTGRLQPELLALIQRHVEAVREHPEDSKARATLGLVYEANELWVEALASYEQAVRLQPDEPMWVHHAAIAAQVLGEYATALALLQDAAERFPDFAPIHDRLGEVLLGQGQVEQAAIAFEQTIRSTPQQCAGFVGLADVRLRQRAYKEAAGLLERALALTPNYATAHHLLGLAYRGLGRGDEARQQLALGMNAKKHYLVDAWGAKRADFVVSIYGQVDRARQLLDAGRVEEGFQKLEGMLASRPDEFLVLRLLGPAYIKAGRLEDAHRVLLHAKSIDATDLDIYINLAWCYRRMLRMDDALHEAELAVQLFPDAWKSHFARALAMGSLNRLDEEYESLATAARLNAPEPSVYLTAGKIAEALGRDDAAKAHYRTAVDRWPERPAAPVRLARLCMRLGEWDQAETVIRSALVHSPKDSRLPALMKQLTKRRSD